MSAFTYESNAHHGMGTGASIPRLLLGGPQAPRRNAVLIMVPARHGGGSRELVLLLDGTGSQRAWAEVRREGGPRGTGSPFLCLA